MVGSIVGSYDFFVVGCTLATYAWKSSCAQLGAPTGSVPNLNHHSIALELARYAHIRFDLCARIEIFVSCHKVRGSGSTTCRSFPQTYPRFFLRFDRFPNRIYNARAVTRWHKPPSSSQNSLGNLYIYIYRQDMPESLHGPDRQTLRKCPVKDKNRIEHIYMYIFSYIFFKCFFIHLLF